MSLPTTIEKLCKEDKNLVISFKNSFDSRLTIDIRTVRDEIKHGNTRTIDYDNAFDLDYVLQKLYKELEEHIKK